MYTTGCSEHNNIRHPAVEQLCIIAETACARGVRRDRERLRIHITHRDELSALRMLSQCSNMITGDASASYQSEPQFTVLSQKSPPQYLHRRASPIGRNSSG